MLQCLYGLQHVKWQNRMSYMLNLQENLLFYRRLFLQLFFRHGLDMLPDRLTVIFNAPARKLSFNPM